MLRTDKRDKRQILTANGQLAYTRNVLRPTNKQSLEKLQEIDGAKSVVPMDCCLGIDNMPFKMTVGAMLLVAQYAQSQPSYQRAEELLEKMWGVKVNDDTIRNVTDYVGKIVFDEDCKRAQESYDLLLNAKLNFTNRKTGVLYIETDGAALNTRARNADGSTWRENKLGVVFSSDNIHFWTSKKGERRHIIGKREYTSYVGSVDEFKKHLFACALRGGYGAYRETVIISDGAAWIRNLVDELFHGSQQILDYYHLCENVNEFAKHIFHMDESKFRPWAKDICDELKKGNSEKVLNELKQYSGKKNDGCPINLYGYITNNINNISYPEYEAKGYFIGSGAIESGNKVILQKRLKQAGMRWNVPTAQYVLTLISKAESGLWHSDVEQVVLNHFKQKQHYRSKR